MSDVGKQPKDLAVYLREANRILVFTGAGVSTASGIPDFRGPGGIWTRRQPVYFDDFVASESARLEHWDYKLESWPAFRDAQPNAIHHAVVQLERAGRLLLLVTQNIDGLHSRAGTSPGKLVELHGTNGWVECLTCGRRTDPQAHFDLFARTRRPPVCECGGFLKPATISFGQALPERELQRAWEAADETDCVVALGSSLSVYPAAQVPLTAAQRGVPYLIVNRGPTEHDHLPLVTLRLDGAVEAVFPGAVRAACGA